MPVAMEDRPPYVVFEVRPEEDRAQTQQTGHYVAKDVVYAVVTPAGSKDRIEREVSLWLASTRQGVRDGRMPEAWLRHYEAAYAAFKSGQEPPLSGTPLRSWPPASPAIVATCIASGIRTVEDLAQANEEALGRLGMGARALRETARNWLSEAASSGTLVARMAEMEQRLEATVTALAAAEAARLQQTEIIGKLEAQLDREPQAVPVAKKL